MKESEVPIEDFQFIIDMIGRTIELYNAGRLTKSNAVYIIYGKNIGK